MSAGIIDARVPKARLDAHLETAPPHLKPILYAVRFHGVGWGTITQRAGRFDLPASRPNIVVLGDDLYEALGPTAFHRRSVRRLIETSVFCGIVACEALPEVYAQAAGIAVLSGKNTVVIETLPRFEADWHDLVRRTNPRITMTIATVRPEGTA